VTDEQIQALENQETWAQVFSGRERAALRLADAMSGPTHMIDEDILSDAKAQFSENELAELILVCGQANLNNRVGNAAKQLLGNGETDRRR